MGLALRGTLGEGGMGIVRLATQRSLGRDVAVKTVKGSQAAERATGALLREACVMGLLEHPNVVPVYDLVVGDAGEPAIVMRKIEGSSWASVMHDPAALRARFDAEDALEWNLRVLAQVCNVVDFAHSRGILHRDLKPENVMLGEFGEVYVVDWGLAVALREGLGPAIPPLSGSR
ncbi:MAG: protein kinase [Sandaracinaceae bacterium]|nr:protein kinase [Sandaracinaceae bacterium]